MFPLLMPSDELFHSSASSNSVSKAGNHFAKTLVVARSSKPLASFPVINNNLLWKECMKFEYMYNKSPIVLHAF